MKRLVYALILLLVLSACNSTKRAQRKIDRIVKHHPELLETKYKTIIDTIITDSLVYDTSGIILPGDTMYIYQNRFNATISRVGDTVSVFFQLPPDTIIKTIETPYNEINTNSGDNETATLIKIAIVLILLGFILLLAKKVSK